MFCEITRQDLQFAGNCHFAALSGAKADASARRGLRDIGAEVRGHDDDDIREIDRAPAPVSHSSVVEQLQKGFEYVPVRLFYLTLVVLVASVAMISFMFLAMVRVDDPLVPRAIFGVLNTLLFFPSGAISPIEGFPSWLRWMSVIDPFTYTVHALRNLTIKSTGIEGIYRDVIVLSCFAAVMIAASIALFKRQL